MTAIPSQAVFEDRVRQVYRMLCDAAANGARCPTNNQFSAYFGITSKGSTSNYLFALEKRGLITIKNDIVGRIVTIVETGQSTAPFIAKHKPRERRAAPVAHIAKRKNDYDSPARVAERLVARDAEDRSPCRVCGARGDLEHTHRRRA